MPLDERWLIDRGRVLGPAPSTGRYTVELAADLHCRLAKLSTESAGSARSELLARRRLYWPSDYELPSDCQVEVTEYDRVSGAAPLGTSTWNVLDGTEGRFRNRAGTVQFRAADVVRVEAD